jgi:hypothetical protein
MSTEMLETCWGSRCNVIIEYIKLCIKLVINSSAIYLHWRWSDKLCTVTSTFLATLVTNHCSMQRVWEKSWSVLKFPFYLNRDDVQNGWYIDWVNLPMTSLEKGIWSSLFLYLVLSNDSFVHLHERQGCFLLWLHTSNSANIQIEHILNGCQRGFFQKSKTFQRWDSG